VAGERTADQIQGEIEQARVALATSVDQLTYRTNPKRILDEAKTALKQKAQTTQGKAVLGGVGAVVVLMVIRRFRHR
jgi:hypothetical protein